jgi:hypothetical protein
MHLAASRTGRRIDVPSVLLAVALTTSAFAGVFVVSAPTMFYRAVMRAAGADTPQETLVFFEPQHSAVPVRRLSATARAQPTNHERRAPPPVDANLPHAKPRAALPRPTRGAKESDVAPTLVPRYHAPIRFTPSPFELPHVHNPFLSEAPRTRAEMDSILAVRRDSIPKLSMTYTPTVAVRDSLIKAQARTNVVPGRAPQMMGNGMGGGIGFTFLSPGPSAAERRRDSAANAEYVGRLRRLQDRVRSARESLRLADSMTRRRTP